MSLLFASQGCEAMGLGPASVQSGLGQPLRMSLPVSMRPEEEIGCIQVRASSDDLPAVLNARTSVVRTGSQTRIEIRSLQAVDEPAIALVVTVGCTSPISREYAIFLDPPGVAPTAAAVGDGSRAQSPLRADQAQPVRQAPSAVVPAPTGEVRSQVRNTLPVAPRGRQPAAAAAARAEAPQASRRPAVTAPPVASRGDRLTVVPSEAAAPGTPTSQAGPSTAPATTPAVPVTPPTVDSDAVAARAQAQQQAELQLQVKALSDQIAALKVQITSLAARNQALEQSGFSSTVSWLLVLLAVLAILVAAWMAWRYRQLQRSIEGAAWWTGNTAMAAPDGDRSAAAEEGGAEAALDPGTRFAPRSRGPAVPSRVSKSSVEAQRPATVRAGSPPRDAERPTSPDDSVLAPLGGPTLPLPFPVSPPPPRVVPSIRAIEVVEHHADDVGNLADIDIAPQAPPRPGPSTASGKKQAATGPTASVAGDEVDALDYKFEIGLTFDPMATDSVKNTVVDTVNRVEPMAFDLNGPSNTLDLEFPSATQIVALTNADPHAYAEPPVRPDDLLATERERGADPAVEADDRDGSPLSTTEVDRLTSTAAEGPPGERSAPSPRALLARFADLMDQVDAVESSDPLRAIALLRQHVLRSEKIPTLLWLRLFELYRKVDKKPVFEALAELFARRYNRPMVGWALELSDFVPQTPLSEMGPIAREIESLWGEDEGLERIRSLLCDRDLDDDIIFNAVLQRDLLDAAKTFPPGDDAHAGGP